MFLFVINYLKYQDTRYIMDNICDFFILHANSCNLVHFLEPFSASSSLYIKVLPIKNWV